MRAPPPPRISKSNSWLIALTYIKNLFHCHKLKRKWNLYKLKKKSKKSPYKPNDISPISGIRVEDMMNIPTNLLPHSSKSKPLLIATFPRGCARSPNLKYLEKNSLTRRTLTKKKYKTERLNNSRVKIGTDKVTIMSQYDSSLKCVKTVRSIRENTKKYADVRLIFHDVNTIAISQLRNSSENLPTKIEFDGKNCITLNNTNENSKPSNILT